jgi:peptidoglycan hydrolase-like protein with peptidoglycan-binding domain
MSVDAFSSLPFQAGGAVAAAAGRTAMWVISAYMRAPLRNTAIAALVTFSAMAGSNALYKQSGHHPAPLFGSFSSKAEPAPIMPLERPAKLLAAPSNETTSSISVPAATPVNQPIGNEDVFEVQRKLTAFKLFDGKVDGLYGPRTARSLKAFEVQIGREPTGKLTQELVELIRATPIIAEPAKLELAPVAETAPSLSVTAELPAADTPAVEPLALVEPDNALPAPAPLLATPAAEQATVTDEPAAESLALTATDEAAEGSSTVEMTSPPPAAGTPTKRTVQTIAVRASAPAPAQTMPDVLTTPIDVTKVGTDPTVVGAIQRGLSSLGFLHGEIDGVAGEATAKAIRNFEVYYNYNVTGRITPELVNLLVQNGAVI